MASRVARGAHRDRAGCGLEAEGVAGAADPAMTRCDRHALGGEAAQPGAEQRRRLERVREDAAGAADDGGLAEVGAPGAQGVGVEARQRGGEPGRCGAVAGDEAVERFGMGDVEAAAPGEQELAADRGHAVEHRHRPPRRRESLGRHQPGRAAANDRHIHPPSIPESGVEGCPGAPAPSGSPDADHRPSAQSARNRPDHRARAGSIRASTESPRPRARGRGCSSAAMRRRRGRARMRWTSCAGSAGRRVRWRGSRSASRICSTSRGSGRRRGARCWPRPSRRRRMRW